MLGLGFLLDGIKGRATDIIGAIMAVALVGAVLWGLRVDHLRGQHLEDLRLTQTQLMAETNAHNTTLASLSQCRSKIDETNAAADARAKADAERLARYKQRIEAMQADAQASDDRIERLKGIAQHAAANASCEAPEALLKELEGL